MPRWGINWLRYHPDMHDMPHIERMGYRSFTIYEWMWNNRDFCRELLSVARQDAIFLNRDHPLSEQKDDEWLADPAGKGRKHADEWARKVAEGKVYTPLDRTFFLGLNEPDSNRYQRHIDAYNEHFCRRLSQHGLRGAAYSFGVGHPSTVGLQPDTPVDWTWYTASATAIMEGGHIAAFHEYGAPGGYGWGNWCNRIEACPFPFKVVFDECGIDYGVVDSGNLKGWMAFMQPEQYLAWLDGFQAGMAQRAASRVVDILSYNVFCYDHGRGDDKDWHSFDIRPLRGLIENYPWTVVEEGTDNTVYLPSVPNQQVEVVGPTAVVNVPAGANIRRGPAITQEKLGAEPNGTHLVVVGRNVDGSWWEVDSRFGRGWVSADVVLEVNTAGVPVTSVETSPPPEPQDNWRRSREFVRRWEGGFQDFDWDSGNWTGCQPGVGIKRGTNYGISACSYPHLDIRNLTMAQADDIYYRDFWLKSGADKLPWPYCLLVFDTAVLHGTGTAQAWLTHYGNNKDAFLARRLMVYVKSNIWDKAGNAWVRRVAELLEIMSGA